MGDVLALIRSSARACSARAAVPWLVLVLVSGLIGCGGGEPEHQAEILHVDGPHDGLDCTECHGPSGGGAPIGLSSLSSCQECHPFEDLPEVVTVADIRFPHRRHGERFEGLGTPCSACHHHPGPQEDLSVDTGGCFLCHAELPGSRPRGQAHLAEETCTDCHAPEKQPALASASTLVDHSIVVERGIACLSCHSDVIQGVGHVRDETCLTCHGAPGLAKPLDPDRALDVAAIHASHQPEGMEMGCNRCHDPLAHGGQSLASALSLDCGSCHLPDDPAIAAPVDSTVHRAQQILYAGLAVEHDEMVPAGKFAARVSCSACHSHSTMRPTIDHRELVPAMDVECTQCHGGRFAGLLQNWITGMRRRTADVGSYVERAVEDPVVAQSAVADSVAGAAVSLWEMVEHGNGVHNIVAADALLRSALEGAEKVWRLTDREPPEPPLMGPDPAKIRCVHCHYGVENNEVGFHATPFDHEPHLMEAGLECTECHTGADLFLADKRTFDPEHGQTVIGIDDCAKCHHQDATAASCNTCHLAAPLEPPRTALVPFEVSGAEREVEWSHSGHEALACERCHSTPGSLAPPVEVRTCQACHLDHHTAGRDCSHCHAGPEVGEAHDVEMHTGCAECHPAETIRAVTPDRNFCLVCHQDQTNHQIDSAQTCTECHFLEKPADFRRRLVSTEGES
jgi:hypothetical protein